MGDFIERVRDLLRAGEPIHVVWGIPKGHDKPVVLVTAYRPDPGGGIKRLRGGGNDETAKEVKVCA